MSEMRSAKVTVASSDKRLAGSVIARVEDLLEAMDETWFPISQLVAEYEDRWGPVKESAITKAAYRLRIDGSVLVAIRWKGHGRFQK